MLALHPVCVTCDVQLLVTEKKRRFRAIAVIPVFVFFIVFCFLVCFLTFSICLFCFSSFFFPPEVVPAILLFGLVVGWILGSRAAADAYASELRRREERAARKKTAEQA